MAQTTSDPAQQLERSDSTASKRTPADDNRPPWRVEGARSPQGRTGGRLPPQRPSLWALLLLLLVVDWIFVLAFQPSAPARVTVPYTYFTQQIQAGNVATVTAQGSAIQGTFRHAVTYPAQNGSSSGSPNATTSSAKDTTTTTYFATVGYPFSRSRMLGSPVHKRECTIHGR